MRSAGAPRPTVPWATHVRHHECNWAGQGGSQRIIALPATEARRCKRDQRRVARALESVRVHPWGDGSRTGGAPQGHCHWCDRVARSTCARQSDSEQYRLPAPQRCARPAAELASEVRPGTGMGSRRPGAGIVDRHCRDPAGAEVECLGVRVGVSHHCRDSTRDHAQC